MAVILKRFPSASRAPLVGGVTLVLACILPMEARAQVDLDAEAEEAVQRADSEEPEEQAAEPAESEAPAEPEVEAEPVEADPDEGPADEELDASSEAAEPEPQPAPQQPLPDIGDDVLEVFVLDRGFYVASDLGIFFTLGGTRGYSNVQPYLSVNLGLDIGDYFGIQLNLSTGYSSGNPVSQGDRPQNNLDATASYGIFNAGVQAVVAFRPTQRFAIELTPGVGYTFIDPPLSNKEPPFEKIDGNGGHATLGVDLKYLTLLTNFTAGVSIDGYVFFGGYGVIPAIAAAAVVRYTL